MRSHLLWILLLTSCSPAMAPAPTSCPTAPSRAPTIAAAVDSATTSIRADSKFVGLAVGVLDQGTAYTQYYGQADLSSSTPLSGTSILRIGSLTKTYTATLLADLAQRGVVAVGIASGDPPETKVNPPCTPPASRAAITLGQLGSHTSGLPASTMPNPVDEASAWTHFCGESTMNAMPGYLYSNFGYDILGYDVAARASQPSWEAAVQATITDPLGMPDTRAIADLDASQLSRVAKDYTTNASGTIVANADTPFAGGDDPAGALLSTLPDQMKWLAFNMRDGTETCSTTDKVCMLSHALGLLRLPRGASDRPSADRAGLERPGPGWMRPPLLLEGRRGRHVSCVHRL
jgi:CubicO group peptidase (beta-lactamase class C family)